MEMGLVGRVLISSPFLLVSLAYAVSMLRETRYAGTARDRIKITLIALAVAAPGVGIMLMVVTADDAVWCTDALAGDPRCRHAPP